MTGRPDGELRCRYFENSLTGGGRRNRGHQRANPAALAAADVIDGRRFGILRRVMMVRPMLGLLHMMLVRVGAIVCVMRRIHGDRRIRAAAGMMGRIAIVRGNAAGGKGKRQQTKERAKNPCAHAETIAAID